ncbi:coenzyme F420-dependent N5,N10-methylene tetrahydromethanopterin reductase [Klebsiella pneumoniae]|uniref:Coenzyme F420-dependent N5,N10-methylene tetrahydromethanopterin reductase n=1 Tax=Klebsiella pneumoniae TaxID=573 RepID=A0A377U133_KLEPN|nr:coenzyme F420-dependent N5,N10-methylene tetrahydromethanopterin reductase [Klebsiella pneumoniae]
MLKYLHTNAIQSAVEAFSTADPNRQWTVQAWPIGRGSAASVRWWLAARKPWRTSCSPGSKRRTSMALTSPMPSTHETFRDVVELLVPELQKRGVFKQSTARGPCAKNCSAAARVWPRLTRAPATAAMRARRHR